jgi:hypothetical protein
MQKNLKFFLQPTPELDRNAQQWQKSCFPTLEPSQIQVEGTLLMDSEGETPESPSIIPAFFAQTKNWLFQLQEVTSIQKGKALNLKRAGQRN